MAKDCWEYIGRVPLPKPGGGWHECYMWRLRDVAGPPRLHYISVKKFWRKRRVRQV